VIKRKSKTILLVTGVILIIGILMGCTSAAPHGWSGVAVADNKLYIGSTAGTLVGLNATDRSRLFNDIKLVSPSSSSFLGCAPASTTTWIYGTPVIASDLEMVFIAGYNGKIYGFSTNSNSNGVQKWVYPNGNTTPFVSGLALYKDKLYIGGNDGKVYAFDAKTGTLLWANPFVTGNKIWATPVVRDDTLYIGSYDKSLYAINLADGTEKWHFPTQGAIMNTPVVQNGIVYFGSFDRYFYAVNADTGTLLWKSTTQAANWFWANPVSGNNVIYAPNIDGNIYVFDMTSGNTINTINLDQSISSTPVIVGNKLIVASENGKSLSKLWAIDTNTYTSRMIIELKKLIYAPLSVNQNIIYVHTQDNLLYALNADTEVILWSQPVSS
jgi:eukaryotic-like serine/threonine-protein kinase